MKAMGTVEKDNDASTPTYETAAEWKEETTGIEESFTFTTEEDDDWFEPTANFDEPRDEKNTEGREPEAENNHGLSDTQGAEDSALNAHDDLINDTPPSWLESSGSTLDSSSVEIETIWDSVVAVDEQPAGTIDSILFSEESSDSPELPEEKKPE